MMRCGSDLFRTQQPQVDESDDNLETPCLSYLHDLSFSTDDTLLASSQENFIGFQILTRTKKLRLIGPSVIVVLRLTREYYLDRVLLLKANDVLAVGW